MNPPGLFITGTDTSVGKTRVAACIASLLTESGLRVGVYKPAASGCRLVDGRAVSDDAEALWQACGRRGSLEQVCPQCFQAPLAPHLAAQAEGKSWNAERLRQGLDVWRQSSDIVLVEGAGGLMSPLGPDEYVADLALDLGYPLIVVAPNVIGAINQTLQTLITASTFREGLSVAGVVLNHPRQNDGSDPSIHSNRDEIAKRIVPPVLAELAWNADRFDPQVDWMAVARADRL